MKHFEEIEQMKSHHKRAIEKLTENLKEDDKVLALIITGSVAKGSEREDSDIDIVLVVTDEEFKKRKKRNRFIFFDDRCCDYPGGYIDGKIVDYYYLKLAAERGTEPARDAFRGAIIAFSKIPDLEDLLRKIPVYQKAEKEEKIKKFVAQLDIANWFMKEAERRNDNYLKIHAARELVLYGGRLILAYNEILYPYHKLFMGVLEKASEKPKNLMELVDALLTGPNSENSEAFYKAIRTFTRWKTRVLSPIRFMLDTELAWIDGKIFVGDI